ncbi:MAG: LamG domain-containing protein, partial [Planctomycetota bacterium]
MCKKLIYLVSFVLVLSMAGNATAELILHWRFDEGSGTTVNDSSGNGHVGTIEGATWTVSDKGPCLEFGGDGDLVVDENGPNYLNGLDAVSIAIWVKSDVAPTDKGFIICEQPDGGDNIITMRYDSSGATGGGTSLLKMAVVAPSDEQQLESSSNLQVTEWQHVVLTWSRGEQLKFYVNGVLDTPQANGAPRDVSTSNVTTLIVGQGGKDSGGGWDGLIDDVRIYDHVLSEVEILGAMEGTVWPYAIGPVPADGEIHPDTWANLSWSPGALAVSHDVYFGDNFDDVSAGAENTFQGNQASTFLVVGFPGFAYPDGLVPGTTYYWRIDEVNDTEPNSPWKGDVWSFMIPPKTAYAPDPADNAESIDPDAKLSWTGGFGAKLHTVYFGDNFDDVNNAAGGLPQGATTYTPGPLKLAKTYYWRVDEFDAVGTYKGHVWSFTTQGAVGSPDPSNGAVDVKQTQIITWSPGIYAASHQLYFGTDKDAVKNADTGSPEYKGTRDLGAESYDPGMLEWDTAYYWRIDEVNNTNPDSPWTGILWSFTTANFLIVDDFESYNDLDPADPESNRIFNAWLDGYDDPTNGSLVGYENPPFAEQTIVHGGIQSMPLYYDNSVGNSEATL